MNRPPSNRSLGGFRLAPLLARILLLPTIFQGWLPAVLHGQAISSPDPLSRVQELDRKGDYAGALRLLRPALQDQPESHGLLTWMAEVLADSSEIVAKTSPQAAKALCEEAAVYARNAVEVAPQDAGGWFHLGRTLGTLSQLPGGWETVGMAKESREAFERALSLDPNHIGALIGLAVWHREAANLPAPLRLAARLVLPVASNEEAVEFLNRAIRIEPDGIPQHLELGRTYLAMGRGVHASPELETVLGLPERDHLDRGRKEEASRLLESIRR